MSRYDVLKNRLNSDKHLGYKYKGLIFIRSIDNNLLSNPIVKGFVSRLEDIIQAWVYNAKSIKKFVNYNIDKNSDKIN